jgi:serine/threonine-protein kinase
LASIPPTSPFTNPGSHAHGADGPHGGDGHAARQHDHRSQPSSSQQPIGLEREHDDGPAPIRPQQPVQPTGDPASSRGDAAASAADQSKAGAREGNPNESSRSGSSLDTVIGKLVVDRGLVTREEFDEVANTIRERSATGRPATLEDVLVEREFLTRRQIQRLKTDLEADRSSQRIPGYKIIRKLGSGAMATVYLGRQLSLDRLVAIKVLPKKFSSDPKFIERFYKEGRAAARLNDHNIVGAYDVGQAGEHHYFVMEYVDGETVYDRIVAKRRFSEKEALQFVRQVASALKHAHEQGFIHRDIKPKNIMISKTGSVKLADLGLARAMSDKEAAEAESGRAFGTPYYISPEQIRGEKDIGPPSDIYGLGATFFHMVTGRVPFEGKSPSEVMHRHLKAQLTPPDHLNPELSSNTAQIIEMMLQKAPRDRYGSAAELIHDIDLVLKGEAPEHARPHVDLSVVAKSAAAAPSAPLPKQASAMSQAAKSPTAMLLMVGLAASVVLNLLLVAYIATR